MATNISRLNLNATSAKAWEALTDPAMVKAWQYGSELITDWKVGNEIRFKTEWQGQIFEQWGTVLHFEPTSRLKYSLFAPRPDIEDIPENYFRDGICIDRKRRWIRIVDCTRRQSTRCKTRTGARRRKSGFKNVKGIN